VLASALLSHWRELATWDTALMHIEFHRGTPPPALEFLKVWESTKWGTWDLVCDYQHAATEFETKDRVTFYPPYASTGFKRDLELIVQNLAYFVDRGEPTRDGLVQVSTPDEPAITKAKQNLANAFRDRRPARKTA
jgi:hypothetical protein